MSSISSRSGPVEGPIVVTFFRFVIPSVLSLLAISTASVIDGFFVGNYLGAEALAAVNLLMPYFTLLFGIALMLAVGGSVKAGIAIGRGEGRQASEIFSKTLSFVVLLNLAIVPLVLLFSDFLFAGLGADPALFPMMQDYFSIICIAMVVQLSGLVLYYFLRADNHPELGMQALLIGAVINITLDGLFIYVFEWGIQGAALATLLAQCVQLFYLLRYFSFKDRNLQLRIVRQNWSELWRSAYNGFSEFINEISAGIVVLVIHWIINQQSGTEGIAAFSVVNYLIFVSLMVYYGIVDAMHVLLSQNFGAGSTDRVARFMVLATTSIAVLSLALVTVLLVFQDYIIAFFLNDSAASVAALAAEFIYLIWPLFVFNGFNVLVCAYLTSAEKAFHSSSLALSRSLALPVFFAVLFHVVWSGNAFLYAFPLAEGVTFILALVCMVRHTPSRLVMPAVIR
ncbi:Na+-driven multidrug efflux pump [Oleiphilus messinensis]|uniref:Na+-driven multidrug efflux pump n=1 Tax=Oleiphilus messinensis TaxID=141451 RepID=A0A1Y0I524_9GAMM|nr:MATE family efflux transporter [Oleiphilus messinensis]ARU54635.1 Na+-driven multidrug efflux pump [Oleiphilus messinensis]